MICHPKIANFRVKQGEGGGKQGEAGGKQGEAGRKQGGRGREIGKLNINNSGFVEILATLSLSIITYSKGDKELVKP
jgi:hypothetical protein